MVLSGSEKSVVRTGVRTDKVYVWIWYMVVERSKVCRYVGGGV